jgi:hypothetical protein
MSQIDPLQTVVNIRSLASAMKGDADDFAARVAVDRIQQFPETLSGPVRICRKMQ